LSLIIFLEWLGNEKWLCLKVHVSSTLNCLCSLHRWFNSKCPLSPNPQKFSFPILLWYCCPNLVKFHFFQLLFQQLLFFTLLFPLNLATWSRNDVFPGPQDNSRIRTTSNYDPNKYPVCKPTSQAKECNVFYECQNFCSPSNKPTCSTRYIKYFEFINCKMLDR